MGSPSGPPSAQAHMPSRPSGADKEKERAQNEGSRGAGVSRRPLDRADCLPRRHGCSLVSAVNLADSGKVRVNRGLLVAESVKANQAWQIKRADRSEVLPILAMEKT